MAATASDGTGGSRGGYEYQFVMTPADWLICNICQCPSREPYLTECCGHIFCKSCLEGAKRATTSISGACPMCRSEEFVIFPNKQADRAVRSLHVFCANKEKGCEWQGEVNYVINHLESNNGCHFEKITCSNDCGKCFERQYLTSHIENECIRRKVECQHCHITGEHQFISGEHNKQCPKYPIACPNICEIGNIPRDKIQEHMKMCPLELVQCEYHTVGCEEKIVCKDLKKHNKEKMEEHLLFATKELMVIRGHLKLHQQANIDISLKLQQTENDLTITKRELAATKEVLKSTQSEASNMREQLEKTNNALTIVTQELTVTKSDLNTTMQQVTTYQKHAIVAANTNKALAKLEVNCQKKFLEFETVTQRRISELETKLEKKISTLDTHIHAREPWVDQGILWATHIHTEPWVDQGILWAKHIHTTAAKLSLGNQIVPVMVKMSEYSKQRDSKQSGIKWYSDPFYTHHNGYKVRLGVAAGRIHLSVYLYLMYSPYDDQLSWPLYGNFQVDLLSQTLKDNYYSCSGKYLDEGHLRASFFESESCPVWLSYQCILNKDLCKEHETYLKDDTIFFQVDYKPI